MIYFLKRVRGNINEDKNLDYHNRLPNLIINKMVELQIETYNRF
jgi:hypothetical protein